MNARGALERTLKERLQTFLEAQAELPELLETLRKARYRAGVFGGAVRDLLLQPHELPRDVDLVVAGATGPDLERALKRYTFARTRFGGLRLKVGDLPVDVWSLKDTWAIRAGLVPAGGFSVLPKTTPFNLEAVVAEVGLGGSSFVVHQHGFFQGIATRTLEANLLAGPHQELTAVRAIVFTRRYGLWLGPRLARFIAGLRASLDEQTLQRTQLRHYRSVVLSSGQLRNDIEQVAAHVSENEGSRGLRLLPLSESENHVLFDGGGWPYALGYRTSRSEGG